MATFTERLALVITADGRGAIQALNAVGQNAERNLGQADQRLDRLSAGMTRFGAVAVGASAIAATGLYRLGAAASNVEQAMGGAETVFGDAIGTVRRFSETSAQGFGISQRAALELTARLGSLLQGFGYTEQAAADTSVQLSQLGADLAAAFGGKPEDAVAALGAALRGGSV
jgi:hypothetical protein